MEQDTDGTVAAWQAARREVIKPMVADHSGKIVKLTGDGFLVEFSTVQDAVNCAIAMQRGLAPGSLDFRMGVNMGDIIDDGEDIHGEGVNIAARLEGLADPGGICISGDVYNQVRNRIEATFEDLGKQKVKNVAEPVRVYRLASSAEQKETAPSFSVADQKIRFCISKDGTQIAYATFGSGPPLVKAPNWMSHLEYEWESPIWRHVLDELGKDHTCIRFDQRACGLSDWDVEDVSFDAFVSDLETLVEALSLERFPLLGISQGCAISVAYAVRHPERVSHLVLYGGFARGSYHRNPSEKEQAEAMMTLIRHGWGKDNPAFRQMFTSRFVPEGTHEQMEWFNELQRVSASAENAVRLREAASCIEVTDLLPQVSVPTLILHCRGDAVIPFNEGRRMAATIPDAQFVSLEGNNHLILEHEPAWAHFQGEVRNFLKDST